MKKAFIIGIILVIVGFLTFGMIHYSPKKMTRLVPLDNIARITIHFDDYRLDEKSKTIELNQDEIKEFKELIKNTKFRFTSAKYKTANMWYYTVEYKDGRVIEFGNARVKVYKRNGKINKLKTSDYFLEGALKDFDPYSLYITSN